MPKAETITNFARPRGAFDLALAAYREGTFAQARSHLAEILAEQPKHVPALVLSGVMAGQDLDLDAAHRWLDSALAIEPDNAWAHCNKAYVLLLNGKWREGWPHYEWRLKLPERAQIARLPQARWRGRESLAGKAILVRSEQGFGDILQFCRYVKPLAKLGARVILEAPRPLVSLLADLDGVSHLVAAGTSLPQFDYHSPLMSLPFAFDTSSDNVPSPAAYLADDEAKTAEWRERLGYPGVAHVGLVWSGSTANTDDRYRSLPLETLYRRLPKNLRYVCLQKEIREEDARTLRECPEISTFAGELHDFSDTAALCACMDVVVSVDTSVAHLSAALGKRTWILLQFCPGWRWLLNRSDSPWYSSATLFRQNAGEDWAHVCERVGAQLRVLSETGALKR